MCPYEDCLKVNVGGKTVFKSRNWLEPSEQLPEGDFLNHGSAERRSLAIEKEVKLKKSNSKT
jgi:hypothetical protein